jgi:energy-coupling factor transporter ATP-binding protein EcfA2
MLKSLKIENFRGFQTFDLQQLGRINLLVGENSSGKTSVLEAIEFLCSRANLEVFEAIHEVLVSRGEYAWIGEGDGGRELDLRHLFHGRHAKLGSTFSLGGESHIGKEKLDVSIKLGNESNSTFEEAELDIEWSSDFHQQRTHQLLSPNGGLPVNTTRIRLRDEPNKSTVRVQFVRSSSLTARKMVDLFSQIVLTPEENLVNQALRIIEPRIERIAVKNSGFTFSSDIRGGIAAGLSNSENPVPIGSLGDGIWRMLGLSVALANVKGGVLLVDEIDTGLHFSTMTKMWKLVSETANRLDVQVFATTHSRDCWESLAELIESEKVDESEIIIHRIEQGKPHSVVFDSEMIVIAANQGLEVR